MPGSPQLARVSADDVDDGSDDVLGSDLSDSEGMLRVEHRAINLGVKVTWADDALARVVHGHLSGEEDQLSGLGDGDVVVARCRMQLIGLDSVDHRSTMPLPARQPAHPPAPQGRALRGGSTDRPECQTSRLGTSLDVNPCYESGDSAADGFTVGWQTGSDLRRSHGPTVRVRA